jgi:hypothetical protein
VRVRWWQTEHIDLNGEDIPVTCWDRFVTHRWISPFLTWWHYNVRRYPRPPEWAKDNIARHFGWVDGVPACKGPICEEHEWKVADV